jgi:hypothetical protein
VIPFGSQCTVCGKQPNTSEKLFVDLKPFVD